MNQFGVGDCVCFLAGPIRNQPGTVIAVDAETGKLDVEFRFGHDESDVHIRRDCDPRAFCSAYDLTARSQFLASLGLGSMSDENPQPEQAEKCSCSFTVDLPVERERDTWEWKVLVVEGPRSAQALQDALNDGWDKAGYETTANFIVYTLKR